MTGMEEWTFAPETARLGLKTDPSAAYKSEFIRDLLRCYDHEVAERKRLEQSRDDVRGSLELCLSAMGQFDSTNYDEYGGPHLSVGIDKLGKKVERLEAENAELRDAIDSQWHAWNSMNSHRTRNDGREVVREQMRVLAAKLAERQGGA